MAQVPPVRIVQAANFVRSKLHNLTRRMAPAPLQVLEIAGGFIHSQVVYASTKLGIPDALSSGPKSAGEIAAAVNGNPDAVHRLLRAGASIGLFALDSDGRFGLTAMSRTLRSDSDDSMRPVVLMLGDPSYWSPWGELTYAIQTGKPSADKVYGKPMWEYLSDNPEFETVFNNAMTALTKLDWPTVAAVYDFTPFDTIVDIGGGQGQLLKLILESAPNASGILFEQESVIEQAADFLGACGTLPRCTLECGSFFDTVPLGADLYVMRRVIHDWDDDDAVDILGTIRRSIPDHGTLVILESVVPEDNSPHFAKTLDLDMLIFAGGRERTEAQFRSLVKRAGFEVTRVVPTISTLSVIEVKPVKSG
ncbi:MAG: acetylserotonin O-methyltransferase [Nocardiaceae bacterium]|nr:acetylserotonin O-methyltransferase [Nocardiaceae bacterium]